MLKRSLFAIALAPLLAASFAASSPARAADPSSAQPAVSSAGGLPRARELAGSGDFGAAISELQKYIATNPEDKAATRYLGDLFVRTGDLASAERTYRVVLSTAPTTPEDKTTHDRLGNVLAAGDRVAEAIEEYQKSLPDVVAYSDLVRLHRRIGDLAQFVAAYRTRADNGAFDYDAQLGYGTILRDLHRPAAASAYLQRAVALGNRSCAAYVELGNAFLDLERNDSAAEQFRHCLAIAPNDYSALVDLSLTYDAGRDRAASFALLDRALQLQPNRPEALVNYGYLSDAAGKTDVAIGYYQRALAADVLSRDAYVDLGYDYGQERMFVLAEAAFLKGLSVSPSDGRIEYLLGETYDRQGKRSLARQQFAAAVGSDEPEVSQAASVRMAAMQ